jgi:hypothetical protein
MIYSKYWTIILVFGILACEPAIGVQIGSENEFNSNQIIDIPSTGKNTFNKIEENHHSKDYALKSDKINSVNKVNSMVKKLTNYKTKEATFHKDEKKGLKNKYLSKNIHVNKNNSQKPQSNISVDDKNVHIIHVINNNVTENTVKSIPDTTDKSNTQDTNPSINSTISNETTSNSTDITNGTSNSTDLNNSTVTNNTGYSNGTIFNNTTGNATFNDTALDNNTTSLNSTNDTCDDSESTKQKVINTLWDIGYIATAVATVCAVFPDSTASKVVAVVAAGVAVVAFAAAAIIDWFW